MTESLGPLRRMTNAVVISLILHLLAFVSIVSGHGGTTGSFSLPGVLVVELLATGGQPNAIAATNQPTPFAADPGLDPDLPTGPVPSLNQTANPGDQRQPATPVDQSNQLSDGDRPGYHSGEPGVNLLLPPVTAPAPNPGRPATASPGRTRTEAEPLPSPDIQTAYCASCPPPPYPELARRRGIEGDVTLSVQVLPDGRVGDIFVLKSSGFPLLDESALTAVKSYTFFAATDHTGPVASSQTITVPFRLAGP